MVREKRILFGAEDIKAIRLRCGECRGDVLLDLTRDCAMPPVPEHCPLCDSVWLSSNKEKHLEQQLVSIVRRTRDAIGRGSRAVGVLFEMDDGEGADERA